MLEIFSPKKNKEQFSEIYNQNFDYVYSFIFARTGGDTRITEELVQETFAAAWSALERFKHRSQFKTWLCGIAKNKLHELYRRKAPVESNQTIDMDCLTETPSDFELEELALRSEMKTQVQTALGRINPVYRYSLIMKHIDGYSVKQIAERLGRSAKAVDGILQKAKQSFTRELKMEKGRDSHE